MISGLGLFTRSSTFSAVRRGLLTAPALVFVLAVQATAKPLFSAAFMMLPGLGPVASADLNGDDLPDLVAGRSVMLGNGDGTFSPAIDIDQAPDFDGSGGLWLISDLNLDGHPDLIARNLALLGNGDGTFGDRVTFDGGPDHGDGNGTCDMAIADLNSDGRPDLAVVNYDSVSVFLGNGDGTFAIRMAFEAGAVAGSVAIADFNNDGRLDLTVGLARSLAVLLGNGDGTFATMTTYGTPGASSAERMLIVGDFNIDGHPDLVVGGGDRYGLNRIGVMLGNGDGSFGSSSDPEIGGIPTCAAVADLNADGASDVIVGQTDEYMVVLLGGRDGPLGSRLVYVGSEAHSVGIADFNVDGKLDFVTGSWGTSIFFGNGDGTFGTSPILHGVGGASSVAAADLDADGHPDLVAGSVLLNNGDGTFTAVSAGTGANPLAIADFDGDGRLDLATTGSVQLGNGDGTFGVNIGYPAGGHRSLVTADLNVDGTVDLVGTDYWAPQDASTVSVLLGNKDGTFTALPDLHIGAGAMSVAVADLNADDRPDLVVADYPSDSVIVLTGNGNGTFQPGVNYATADGPRTLAIADLNEDGQLDLAVACGFAPYSQLTYHNGVGGWATVLLGNGDGTFGTRADYETGNLPTAVAISDLNADGRQDLAIGCEIPPSIYVLPGNGDGTFAARSGFAIRGISFEYTSVDHQMTMAIADLNADGLPDVAAVAGSVFSTLSVMLNRTSTVLTPTLLNLFEATWRTEGIQLRWQFGAPGIFLESELERGGRASGPWTRVGSERLASSEAVIFVDQSIEAGQTYCYRLVATRRDGSTMTFGPLVVRAGQAHDGFELLSVAPSPTRDQARIDFTVAREAHVRLSVLDIQGRHVARLADAVYQPGRYQTVWDGRSDRGRAPAGLYLVRYEWPGQQSVRRLLLIN